jgi:hypothetical protein
VSVSLRAKLPRIILTSPQPRQIELPDYDIDTVGSFLEYLYTGEYFPKKLPGQRVLESDPAIPSVDNSGDQLLKHARIYTLAEKFGVDGLKTLSSSKIHCVNSTAKGEIAYARYVYAFTSNDDTTIRAPVASFWATRSHTLRAEAEEEFKALCLEHPQFGYDVLSMCDDLLLNKLCADNDQPASWTTSSSESATTRCTLLPAVLESAPVTAAARVPNKQSRIERRRSASLAHAEPLSFVLGYLAAFFYTVILRRIYSAAISSCLKGVILGLQSTSSRELLDSRILINKEFLGTVLVLRVSHRYGQGFFGDQSERTSFVL